MPRRKDFWIDGPIEWFLQFFEKGGSKPPRQRLPTEAAPAKASAPRTANTKPMAAAATIDTKVRFGQAESSARRNKAIAECLLATMYVPAIAFLLWFAFGWVLPLILMLPLWTISGALYFSRNRRLYRFQVAEKSQKLIIGPSYELLVGSGHWWKYRFEDMKDDNKFFTGRAPEFPVTENIEGGDEGNRVDFDAVFVYSVTDGSAYNALGNTDTASKIVVNGISADFRRFCRDVSRGPSSDPMPTEEILRQENQIRDKFDTFFATMQEKYQGAWGVQLDLNSSRLDNLDYDAETKRVRREVAEAVRLAKAERERQDIITSGVADPRLALAADPKSQQVSVEAFELDLSVEGDPAIASALTQIARNPGALAAFTGGRKGGKKK